MNPVIVETFRNYPPTHTKEKEEAKQLAIEFGSAPLKMSKSRRKKNRRKLERLAAQNYECAGCELPISFESATWDHIKPRIRGGSEDFRNKVLMCVPCNASKSDCETLDEALGQLLAAINFTDRPNAHQRNRAHKFAERVMVMASLKAKGIISA